MPTPRTFPPEAVDLLLAVLHRVEQRVLDMTQASDRIAASVVKLTDNVNANTVATDAAVAALGSSSGTGPTEAQVNAAADAVDAAASAVSSNTSRLTSATPPAPPTP